MHFLAEAPYFISPIVYILIRYDYNTAIFGLQFFPGPPGMIFFNGRDSIVAWIKSLLYSIFVYQEGLFR